MRAAVLKKSGQLVSIEEKPVPMPKENEVLVEIQFAAINHRDVWIQQGKYGKLTLPCILGSDASGTVVKCGKGAEKWLGKDVIINPNVDWGESENHQSSRYSILGMPTNGTFASMVAVAAHRIHEKPVHLSFQEASSIPLAALTAYRACVTKAGISKNQKVLINGIGGGVALFCMQFAIACGAQVYVTSSSKTKIDTAIKLGAKAGFIYTDSNWWSDALRKVGGFDVIIDSAGGNAFNNLLKVANSGAKIVFYGGTKGNIDNLSPQIMFWKQLHLMGTTMGSDTDFEHMLAFVKQHKIKPVIDTVFPLEKINEAFNHMADAKQFGKIVLAISKQGNL